MVDEVVLLGVPMKIVRGEGNVKTIATSHSSRGNLEITVHYEDGTSRFFIYRGDYLTTFQLHHPE